MNLYQIANHEQPYGGGLSVGVLALIPIDSLCRDTTLITPHDQIGRASCRERVF